MTTEIINLKKSFGNFEALRSINLSISQGEFIAILGPSGCGKTTLLRLIAGFDQPTGGEIRMEDKRVGSKKQRIPPEKRNIGMVFQSFALWPHMKVKDQVEFPLRHHPLTPEAIKKNPKKRVQDVLKLVNLDHLMDRMPNELSGGQKQRVALARAISHQPSLLLMDEPLNSLDAELRENMRREIQSLHRMTKSSIIYVTHDQGEALAMADRIVIMKEGRIEQNGTPEEIFMRPQTPYVASFVGKATIMKGTWSSNSFHPKGTNNVRWDGTDIAQGFKDSGTYPVRPDEWILQDDTEGIEAKIDNALYQGREIRYSVTTVDGITIKIVSPMTTRYQIGEQVWIKKSDTFTPTHMASGN
ncbi:ABC transporter ATP-binding protein [Alteribacillus sp. HJP-4]|uniref:ABC transporter ATP-binding protein n=1 Tax=Alteribacillus sp. HJP-4 TaxID=2775394 RepID=UPI0035CCFEA9